MMKKPKAAGGRRQFGRREFLRTLGSGAAMVAAAEGFADEAHAESHRDKIKARYQPNSKDVQDFYRVNRYPPKRG